jgi:hypothetical protein
MQKQVRVKITFYYKISFFLPKIGLNYACFCLKKVHLGLICHQKMTKKRFLLRKKRLKNAGFTGLFTTFASLFEKAPIIQLICI